MHYGATAPTPLAKLGNYYHEIIDPVEKNFSSKAAKGTRIDFDLSNSAIKAGVKLQQGEWSPIDLTLNLKDILKNKSLYVKYPSPHSKFINTLINASGLTHDIQDNFKKR